MATDKYPNQNVNMPMSRGRVEAARARLTPPRAAAPKSPPSNNGHGSRREVRPGEWFDDRHIEVGGPSSPSADSPPEAPAQREIPASYDPAKVYAVQISTPVLFAGRMLTPGKSYQMAGYVCTEVSPSIVDAVEIGDIPVDPDVSPSVAKKKKA